MTMAQQWSASGLGWAGRLCNVMERYDPRSFPAVPTVEAPKNFATENLFAPLNEESVVSIEHTTDVPLVPVADSSWTRKRRAERFAPTKHDHAGGSL